VPVWKQYLDFWDGVLHWNFGLSFYATEPVTHVIFQAIPYTLALLIPAITLSYVLGNRIGAMAARRKWLDNTVLPVGYLFQAAPYAWLALAMAYYLAVRLRWFPSIRATTQACSQAGTGPLSAASSSTGSCLS
jgi:peptide/nickel transport system permease protein